MSDVSDSVAALSEALADREFETAAERVSELRRIYEQRRDSERETVERAKRAAGKRSVSEAADAETLAGVVSESGGTQFSRAAGLTMATAVVEAHEELAEEKLLEEYVEATRVQLAELGEAESDFETRLRAVTELESVSTGETGEHEEPATEEATDNEQLPFGFGMREIAAGGAVTAGLAYLTVRMVQDGD